MHADPMVRLSIAGGRTVHPAVGPAAVWLAVLATMAILWPTTWSMIELWGGSDEYRHGFVVIPLAFWLVWRERDRLVSTPVTPSWAGLLVIGALASVWLLGVLAAAQVVSQFAMVAICGAVVLTVFGWQWARALWFPLLFLFFAVPVGDGMVPTLMEWTADVTVAALRMSGVPVFREGNHFVIPSGQWSVVEACSGVKFLVASLMTGALYAWLVYRSTARRIAFVGAAVVVPIVANWMRAYLTVGIAHLSDNRLLTGADHQPFGWVLFGAAMILLFAIGIRWREDHGSSVRGIPPRAIWVAPRQAGFAATAVVAWLGLWTLVARALLAPVDGNAGGEIAAPIPTAGWSLAARPSTDWAPDLPGAAAIRRFTYERGARKVGLLVATFRGQSQRAQLATTANRIVESRSLRWLQTSRSGSATGFRGDAVPPDVRSAVLRDMRTDGGLVAWQWYWIGGTATTSDLRSKLELARSRLLRRPDTGLWIVAYTSLEQDGPADEEALREFVRDMGPSLGAAFERTAAP